MKLTSVSKILMESKSTRKYSLVGWFSIAWLRADAMAAPFQSSQCGRGVQLALRLLVATGLTNTHGPVAPCAMGTETGLAVSQKAHLLVLEYIEPLKFLESYSEFEGQPGFY